jgi:long-chain acyl-CoA synthetase
MKGAMRSHNVARLLEMSSERFPDRIAAVLGEERWTYEDLNGVASQVANLLESMGIRGGDKIAMMMPNVPMFTAVYNAILKVGATVVPLNVLLKGREVAYHLRDSDAVALVAHEGTAALPIGSAAWSGFSDVDTAKHFWLVTGDPAAPSPIPGADTLQSALATLPRTFTTVDTDEDDTAVILYTSGTTGQPKGAELRHRNMRDNALICRDLFATNPQEPDTYLAALPLFHSFGQTVIQNAAAAFGATVVMLPRFEPNAVIALMLKESVTFFAGVPTMYWALLDAVGAEIDIQAIASNLRVAVAGGAALPVEIHKRFEKHFGVVIAEGYGLSETSPIASFKPMNAPARPGSIGTPAPGVELALLDSSSWTEVPWTPEAVGEIAIRGHNVFKGYYKRPEATTEVLSGDGWFRSGDLARRDEDGWYYIVDRAKDMIIRGGFNVYPREIEEVLLTHPAVSLAAVIGVPHESHGEEIKAFVILRPGEAVTPEEIVAWCQEQMAAYKYPRIVEIASSLPMTATGKLLKRELAP